MSKKALGIWSFFPLVSLVLGIVLLVLGTILGLDEKKILFWGIPSFILVFASTFSVLVVMMLLLIWAGKRPYITYEEMVTWGLLFYFFNMIVYPIFWNKYIKNWTEEMDTSYVRSDPLEKKKGVYYERPKNNY